MANEIRLRANNISGAINDNPLLIGSTSINSPLFSDLPVVDATNHLIVVLDPLEVYGAAEIVIVTAHTASATSLTAIRGQEGSTARQHPLGTTWFHGPIASDWTLLVTSGTRPSVPYQGELIYETDTDSYVGRAAGSVWQTVVPLGAWTTWNPVFTNVTIGNGVTVAKYAKIGRTIHYHFSFTLGTTSSMGANPTVTLPFAVNSSYIAGVDKIGALQIHDTGSADFEASIRLATSTTGLFVNLKVSATTYLIHDTVDSTRPMTWTTGDAFAGYGTYEASS